MGATEPVEDAGSTDVVVTVVGAGPRTAALADALGDAVPGVRLAAPPGADEDPPAEVLDGVLVGEGAGGTGAVLAAVAAGLPVLCAPPLTDVDEARTLRDAETGTGRRTVQAGFARRHDPRFRELRRQVDDGVLGEVRLVRGVETLAGDDAADGLGLALAHALDTVSWLVDRPVRAVELEAGDGLHLVTVLTEDGPVADLELRTADNESDEVRWEVVGSEGSAELVATTAHLAEAHRIMLTAWVRSLRSGIPTGATADDGLRAALGVAAARRAPAPGAGQGVGHPA